MQHVWEPVREIFIKGGPVMWPLLGVSLLAVALIVERLLFWLGAHRSGRDQWLSDVMERLRASDEAAIRAIIAKDRSPYAEVVRDLLSLPSYDDLAIELIERHRRQFERYGATLSTIITAAPLLGILGTVTGIIESFQLLGAARQITNIESVASGIAEALITTAFGLVVTLVVVFPYMAFRSQAERAFGAIELLAAVRRSAPKIAPSGGARAG